MLQQIILLLIFVTALVYLGRILYRHFTQKDSCPKGCGSCSTVDFEKIARQIKEKP